MKLTYDLNLSFTIQEYFHRGKIQTVPLYDVSLLIFQRNLLQSRSLLEVYLAGVYILLLL